MDDYKKAFDKALIRTKDCGLEVPEIEYLEGCLMHPPAMAQLTDAVKPLFKNLALEEIGKQALSLHQSLQGLAEEVFESQAFYTIGSVFVSPQHYFDFTDEDVIESLEKGHRKTSLKLHAWLTFPTMEILDFSINTRLSGILNQPEIAGKFLAGQPATFSGAIRFQPMLLGDDLIKRTPLSTE